MRFAEFKLYEAVSDPEVVKIQEKLKQLGYDLGNYGPKGDGVDGMMGPYTQSAIDSYNKGIAPKDTPKPNQQAVGNFEKNNDIKPSTGSDVIPTKGPVTGPYGRMVQGPKGNVIPHPGVDIGASTGTPVIAPQSGKIVFAGEAGSAGNLVELITGSGEKHRFMHLSKILVSAGEVVKKGQEVGLVGNTGYSKGAHLHWEKYASTGQQVNPIA
jgi:murein DD-endopeptidase MepM/ murein hydrolase activator NlpD